MMGNIHFSFFLSSQSFKICVIYPYSNNLSVHSCYKNYKNFWTKFYYGIMKFKNFSLKKNFFSLCCRAAGDVKHTKTFLSLSLSSLCVIYHHRGRSSVHSHGSFPPPPTHPPPPPQTCWKHVTNTHTNTHTHTHNEI